MFDVPSIGAPLSNKLQKIQTIPMTVLNNWPAMISFAVVDYISEAIIRMIPRMGGYAGFVEVNIVNGARDVVKFATWDAVRDR